MLGIFYFAFLKMYRLGIFMDVVRLRLRFVLIHLFKSEGYLFIHVVSTEYLLSLISLHNVTRHFCS